MVAPRDGIPLGVVSLVWAGRGGAGPGLVQESDGMAPPGPALSRPAGTLVVSSGPKWSLVFTNAAASPFHSQAGAHCENKKYLFQ